MSYVPPVETDAAARMKQHEQMRLMAQRLIAEHAGVVSAGAVLRCVARCREHLLHSGVRSGLVAATEAAARYRLAQVTPAHATRL